MRATLSRRTRRRLGLALVAYGGAGVLLLLVFGLIANSAIERLALVDPAAGALSDASAILGDTSTAFGGFGTSLENAQNSMAQAATSARDASATSSRLADGMSISIFGAQPLASLSQDFRKEASDLDAMAKQFDALTVSLKSNQQDVAKIRGDMALLKTRVDMARSAAPVSVDSLRALLGLLVLWLALPAIVALGAGAYLYAGTGSSSALR